MTSRQLQSTANCVLLFLNLGHDFRRKDVKVVSQLPHLLLFRLEIQCLVLEPLTTELSHLSGQHFTVLLQPLKIVVALNGKFQGVFLVMAIKQLVTASVPTPTGAALRAWC